MACKRSAVRSRLPPPLSFTGTSACSNKAKQLGQVLSPSSRGLGHHPFTVSTGVRIPVGTPVKPLFTRVKRGFVFEFRVSFSRNASKRPSLSRISFSSPGPRFAARQRTESVEFQWLVKKNSNLYVNSCCKVLYQRHTSPKNNYRTRHD